MGMTMTQKILAAHAGLPSVSAGQLIEADLDLVLGNDITSPVAIHEIGKMNVEGVFHKDKIALVMDHFAPNKDIKSAEHCKCVREFACKNDITNYFDVGEMGIEHALLPEKGLTVAADVGMKRLTLKLKDQSYILRHTLHPHLLHIPRTVSWNVLSCMHGSDRLPGKYRSFHRPQLPCLRW